MNDVVTPLGRPLSDKIRHDLYDRVTGGDQEAVGVAEGGIYVQADQRLHPGEERGNITAVHSSHKSRWDIK